MKNKKREIINLKAPINIEMEISSEKKVIDEKDLKKILKKIKDIGAGVTLIENGSANSSGLIRTLDIVESEEVVFNLRTQALWIKTNAVFEKLKKYSNLLFLEMIFNKNALFLKEKDLKKTDYKNTFQKIKTAVTNGFFVNAVVLITYKITQSIDFIVEKLNQTGIRKIIFRRVPGLAKKEKEALIKIEELKSEGWPVDFYDCFPYCSWPDVQTQCQAGVSSAFIDLNANVFGCIYSDISFGNILKKDFKDIWNSKKIIKWRNKINSGCFGCNFLSECFGGCKCILNEKGKKEDPLMVQDINGFNRENNQDCEDVNLSEDLRVNQFYVIREEEFGCILIKDNRFIPVSRKADRILEEISRKKTLKEIYSIQGKEAINFIYSLYLKNFVNFEHGEAHEKKHCR